jgi:DNA-nicking Smr family endonuclease
MKKNGKNFHNKPLNLFSKKCKKKLLKERNLKNDLYLMDLHGLFVEEATEFVEKRLNQLNSNKGKTLVIITGEGNHSKMNHGLIKEKVALLLTGKGFKFKEVKGQYEVAI